ncbi:MAG: formate--tetrahydrofolate ligase [Bryobacteraceae bacterium]|nr:formate--tetrahydrofolate ligase [Bryobacteraceae bacterium]
MSNLLPISEIASQLNLRDSQFEPWGSHSAKLSLDLLTPPPGGAPGKLILVTAMTPTSAGEGKTVTTIGLTQGLRRIGKRAIATLREPSLGPVFGMKGGATGGGKSQVLPAEKINLHFNGDFHAITSAHNLLSAILDSHLHHGNDLSIDPGSIFWPRALDMNDRSLRQVITGLGGKANGAPREARFVITAASEIMAILALSASRPDLRSRLASIALGYDTSGQIVRAGGLNATGALMVLLNDAILPNLVQTTEHAPAFIHCGPFANIAHGTASVVAQKIALNLAEYVINETGFAADLGAEKYFDIVMPSSGIQPSCAVVIASIRSLAHQGSGNERIPPTVDSVRAGLANLDRHLQNLRQFGVPVVVAINRFHDDAAGQLALIRDFCRGQNVPVADSEVFARGGEGAVELAEAVVAAASQASEPRSLYGPDLSLEAKIETIATRVYGAGAVYFESGTRKQLQKLAALGFGHLPVCIAKTQSSISDNPALYGAPRGFTLTVTEVLLSAGAGFVVVVAGNMMRMPGLGRSPQALRMDVTAQGEIVGLH